MIGPSLRSWWKLIHYPVPLHAWYWFKLNIIEHKANRLLLSLVKNRTWTYWGTWVPDQRGSENRNKRKIKFILITRKYWEWHLKPNQYFVIETGACGLGLLRITRNMKAFIEHVKGKVLYVGYLSLNILYKLSSTMRVRNHKDEQRCSGIMFGPMSSVNHYCDSTLHRTQFPQVPISTNTGMDRRHKTYWRKPDSECTDGRTWWNH